MDKKTVSVVMREMGRKGGKRSMEMLTPEERAARGAESGKNMTPSQRSERAKRAAEARWGKKRAKKKA